MPVKFIFFFPLFIALTGLKAQLYDSFIDGDFTSNPEWIGDVLDFNANSQDLQLDAVSKTDTSILSTLCSIGDTGVWTFQVNMDFNPSANNYARVYLMSDSPEPASSQNAYFVSIGGNEDNISLYRIHNGIESNIFQGRKDMLDASSNSFGIQIERNSNHHWILSVDSGLQGQFQNLGQVFDDAVLESTYFSVWCRYTSTRSDKFTFDEFSVVGLQYVDMKPPKLSNQKIINKNTWEICLDEPIDTSIANFSLEINGVKRLGKVVNISFESCLQIAFEGEFKHGFEYQLRCENIQDANANDTSFSVTSYYVKHERIPFKALQITEFMPDPSPPIGLPEVEFIEIHNRMSYPITLDSMQICDENTCAYLPSFILAPKGLICIIDEGDSNLWNNASTSILLDGLPSLNNTGDKLSIRLKNGFAIDSLYYNANWMKNSEGGRSLSIRNSNFLCNIDYNWNLSSSPSGGSPGVLDKSDTSYLFPSKFELDILHLNGKHIRFQANTPLLHLSGLKTLLNGSEALIDYSFSNLLISSSSLVLNENELNLSEFVTCSADTIPEYHLSFTYHDGIKEGLIINEVMFNAKEDCGEYVELYNLNDQSIDLQGVQISSFSKTGSLKTTPISDRYKLLMPKSYIALVKDSSCILSEFDKCNSDNVFELDLPNLYNDEGGIIISDTNGQLLDSFYYRESYHFPLIVNAKGVSLERISSTSSSLLSTNWHSAASTENYGTPGYINSQAIQAQTSSELSISPDIFSPDNDGYQDVTIIQLANEKNGLTASCSIWNSHGQRVRMLLDNEFLGRNEKIIWDGLNDEHQKCPIGYYIVYLDGYHPDGSIIQLKKTVVLAHKF